MNTLNTFVEPSPISQSDLDKLFVKDRPSLGADVFEFALTLGGTVSAGAYTAGVLDYILEALDHWERAKQAGSPDAPTHRAVLSTITGTSGGAINGAIFLRAAGFAFPHGAVAQNPFYNVWVNGVGIEALLTPDNPVSGLQALFNTTAFVTLANDIVKQTGPALGSDAVTPNSRGFLADPLRLCAMVANVTGIPYRISFRGQSKLGHDLVAHEDFVRFGLAVPGGVVNASQSRPDEFPLASISPANWDMVAATALCTSAFPAAFPSQPLKRNQDVVGYRVAVVPGEKPGSAEIAQLVPLWSSLSGAVVNGELNTVNVDGGTVNNEPLNYARVALAGYAARNNRGATDADRAVVLVDPFSDPESLGPSKPPDFAGLLGPLVNTLVYQGRMKPEDIALANDYDTFSRFLVAPFGPGGGVTDVAGARAIAGGGLGGFLGFVDKALLEHDFLLGRRNAYDFLKDEFVLAENHPLFHPPRWTAAQRVAQQSAQTQPAPNRPAYYLPIIPLMPALRAAPPPMPVWPRQAGVPDALTNNLPKRLNSIWDGLKKTLQNSGKWPGGLGAFALNQAWSLFGRDWLGDNILDVFTQALNDQNLLPKTVQKWPLTPIGNAAAIDARTEWLNAGAKSSTITSDAQNWILTTIW